MVKLVKFIKNKINMDMCTTNKAAEILGVATEIIQLWIECDILKAWKTPGGHRRITLASIQKVANKDNALNVSKVADDVADFTILYVEDDEALADLISQLLANLNLNLKVRHVFNGRDALISFGDVQPDLVITDLNMPSMNGFDMIRHIRNNKHCSLTPIAVVTGLNKFQIIEQGGLPDEIKIFSKLAPFEALAQLVKFLVMKKSNLTH